MGIDDDDDDDDDAVVGEATLSGPEMNFLDRNEEEEEEVLLLNKSGRQAGEIKVEDGVEKSDDEIEAMNMSCSVIQRRRTRLRASFKVVGFIGWEHPLFRTNSSSHTLTQLFFAT
ncbi:hypothetical protein AgCh_022187 [Apium graveolens]